MSEGGFAALLKEPIFLTCFGIFCAMYCAAMGATTGSAQAARFLINSGHPASANATSKMEKLKYLIPIIISGVVGIYGLIISIILVGKLSNGETMTLAQGIRNMFAGMVVGGACNTSGYAMACIVDGVCSPYMGSESVGKEKKEDTATAPDDSDEDNAGTYGSDGKLAGMGRALLGGRAGNRQRWLADNKNVELSWQLVVSLVFVEALALYGLVVALFLTG
eukprot:CAMPEP_0198110260 /NCGR_PEP_ID=MMETSP1442-20131203/2274_1 /TAXON_ID= /ORGANISM="Craspedostauros australis, Strain CCMP3328" /LENGTH=220 /DNA_ID=CAMNT_0043766235 /DNA_START=1898 /DNA_END=2560 /DNA_ORIENTATION=+